MSAIDFSVKSDIIQKLEPALHALGPHQFTRAVDAAAKRATTSASKTARKEIPKFWTVKKSSVPAHSIKSRNSGGSWEIYSRGKRLNSLEFSTMPKRGADTTGRNRQKVLMQAEAGKTLANVPRSWLWKAHGGLHLARPKNEQVGPRGGKYMEVKGPAVPQMLSNEKTREPIVDSMVDTFEKRLRHEYEYRLSKAMEGKR